MMGSHRRVLNEQNTASFTNGKQTALWDGGYHSCPCGGGAGVGWGVERAATEKDIEKGGWSRAAWRQKVARPSLPGTHPEDAGQVPGLGVDNIRGQDGGG